MFLKWRLRHLLAEEITPSTATPGNLQCDTEEIKRQQQNSTSTAETRGFCFTYSVQKSIINSVWLSIKYGSEKDVSKKTL